MTTDATPGAWIVRLVLAGGREPAAGVPVTLLDDAGDPAGQWIADADGAVALPRQERERIRVRVGLRSEDPTTITAAALDAGAVELEAPRHVLPALSERPSLVRARQSLPAERAERVEPAGHLLPFTRLLLAPAPLATRVPDDAEPAAVRYGVMLELEQSWVPQGPAAGDLLFSITLAPGESARVALVDRRWSVAGERPIGAAARLMADAGPVEQVLEDVGGSLEPLALEADGAGAVTLAGAFADSVRLLSSRAVRAAQVLRRRPLALRELSGDAADAAVRTVSNPQTDRTLTFHYYEPVERYRVFTRVAGARPAVLVPFRLPALANRAAIRQFGPLLARALRDASLRPDLERLLGDAPRPRPEAPPVSELRLVALRAAGEHQPDLRQVWCFLHVDETRYAVHFFPADAPPQGVSAPAGPGQSYWIGAVRLADFHHRPLAYPGRISLQNGSTAMLAFDALHLEGRTGERWTRLHSQRDVVLPAQSQVLVATLSELADAPGADPGEARLFAHIGANLPYYAAAILAGGDAGLRLAALARLPDDAGRPVASVIENRVVGALGTWVAFPLRDAAFAPPAVRRALDVVAGRHLPEADEVTVHLPLPGVWTAVQPGEAWAGLAQAAEDEAAPRGRRWR